MRTKTMGNWIPVEDSLPEKDQWVQVLEDDTIDTYQVFICSIAKTKIRYRSTPAKLFAVDSENYPIWYLCHVGSSRIEHVRNVTHWKPMSATPFRDEDERGF
jgi:hypothetical protein